jgi:hypothetical protein
MPVMVTGDPKILVDGVTALAVIGGPLTVTLYILILSAGKEPGW